MKQEQTFGRTRRAKLLYLPALSIIILGAVYALSYWYTNQKLVAVTLNAVDAEARDAESRLREAVDQAVTWARQDLDRVWSDEPGVQRELKALVEFGGLFSGLTLFDSLGSVVSSTDERVEPVPAEILEAAQTGLTVVSEPFAAATLQGGQAFRVFAPVFDESGRLRGVLSGTIPMMMIWEGATAGLRNEGDRLVVLDRQGRMLPARDDLLDPLAPSQVAAGSHEGREGSFVYLTRKVPVNAGAEGPQWTLLFLRPYQPIGRMVQRTAAASTAAAMLALTLFGWIGFRLTRDLVSPLEHTARAADRLARGELDLRVPEEGPLELQSIGAAFNHMVSEVKYHRHILADMVEARTRKLELARNAMAKNAAELRASYNSAPEGILVVEAESGQVLQANRRIHDLFGFDGVQLEDLTVHDIGDVLRDMFEDPDTLKAHWDAYIQNPTAEGSEDWELSRPSRRILAVYTAPVLHEDQTSVIGRLWNFRDVTQQREAEAKLRQSQKLEAMGHLAGSLAHDFSNLLTVILGNLSMARMELDDREDVVANLEAAEEATNEATRLARQLLGVSDRGGRLQLGVLNLNDVVNEVEGVLRETAGPQVRIQASLDSALWSVPADREQLRQVLMNLGINAVDAMPSGGHLTLRTENVNVRRGQHQMPAHAEPGDYVRLTVEDDGSGMDAGVRERSFEPFFTTKSHRGSPGLGLAVAYGAIKKHGGWISCESESGEGTRFRVYLLRTEQRSEPMNAKSTTVEAGDRLPCVLVVDDEAGVRRIAVSVLKRCGFGTIQACDGEEAVHQFRQNVGQIDLVLLDLSMPKLSGRETFKELKGMRPDIPILLCSGYPTNEDEFEQETGFRPEGSIQKPFNVMTLSDQVRDVLGVGVPEPVC